MKDHHALTRLVESGIGYSVTGVSASLALPRPETGSMLHM